MSLRDPIAAAVVFAFGTAVFTMAGAYPAPAALFPRAVAVIMMAAALAMGVRAFLSGGAKPAEFPDRRSMLRMGAVIALSFIYILGVKEIGYATASLIFIPVTAWVLGIRNIGLIAGTTVLFVGIVTFLFRHVFSIPLPREALMKLFG